MGHNVVGCCMDCFVVGMSLRVKNATDFWEYLWTYYRDPWFLVNSIHEMYRYVWCQGTAPLDLNDFREIFHLLDLFLWWVEDGAIQECTTPMYQNVQALRDYLVPQMHARRSLAFGNAGLAFTGAALPYEVTVTEEGPVRA